MKTSLLLLILSVAACSGAPDGGNPATPTSNPPATESSAPTVELRLSGVNGTGAVNVQVASVELTLDGQAVSPQVKGGDIDLGNAQQAWVVASFPLPADAEKVGIKLRFQPDGTVESGGKTEVLDLSGPPLSVVASAEEIRQRGKVLLEIDLSRSLVDADGQVYLMPDFIVRY
jgi:hypothetical protein